MNNFISIFLLLLFLFPTIIKKKDPMFNRWGKPSTWGINTYIKNNQESLIKEYEYRIDTIYDVYMFSENLSETEKEDNLGEFYLPDYVVITNEEKFIAYEFKDLSKFKQKTVSYAERTVKAVIFHELTHAYFYQTLRLMEQKNEYVSSEYRNFRFYPNAELQFGVEFIEEGICEYTIYYLNEATSLKNVIKPETEEELINKDNRMNNVYLYSVIFLKDYLDKNGLRKGIEILLENKPPTYKEILKSELFFKRLNY
jgi:hypothetical protein